MSRGGVSTTKTRKHGEQNVIVPVIKRYWSKLKYNNEWKKETRREKGERRRKGVGRMYGGSRLRSGGDYAMFSMRWTAPIYTQGGLGACK